MDIYGPWMYYVIADIRLYSVTVSDLSIHRAAVYPNL